MSITSNYSPDELCALGFAAVGQEVSIDRTCRFFGIGRISLGSHVRIDAYSVLSAGEGGILLGNFVHLSTGVSILGGGRVVLEDFAGLSAKVSVFSSNDDYTGGAMTNPTVPSQYRKTTHAPVTIRRHAVVGANSVILPGVELGVGAAVGALTIVRRSIPPFTIVVGNPMRAIGERQRTVLELEQEVRAAFGLA